MLDPDFTQIGVAVMDVGGKLWVVQDYGRPATGTRARPIGRTGWAIRARRRDRAQPLRSQWGPRERSPAGSECRLGKDIAWTRPATGRAPSWPS